MDITMCTSKNCAYKDSCLRHDESKADEQYQSYCNFEIDCYLENGYEYYIALKNN
jgi:hypothetical protein